MTRLLAAMIAAAGLCAGATASAQTAEPVNWPPLPISVDVWTAEPVPLDGLSLDQPPPRICQALRERQPERAMQCTIVGYARQLAIVLDDQSAFNATPAATQPGRCHTAFSTLVLDTQAAHARAMGDVARRQLLEVRLNQLANDHEPELPALLTDASCPVDRRAAAVLWERATSCRTQLDMAIARMTDEDFVIRNSMAMCVGKHIGYRDDATRRAALDAAFRQFALGTHSDRVKAAWTMRSAVINSDAATRYLRDHHGDEFQRWSTRSQLPNLVDSMAAIRERLRAVE